jgi:hypothetical protein
MEQPGAWSGGWRKMPLSVIKFATCENRYFNFEN